MSCVCVCVCVCVYLGGEQDPSMAGLAGGMSNFGQV